jgi:hypothetical protein
MGTTLKVELLHVAGCANVDRARRLLHECLRELALEVDVVEREGAFPSPTILVNGRDVMGPPPSLEAACRLDLPTHDRLVAALRGV